jgi:hypothetical protein
MRLFRQIYVYLLLGLFIHVCVVADLMATGTSLSNEVAIEEESVVFKKSLVIQVEPEDLANNSGASTEKDFDKIRQLGSYDPKTDTWSAIEDFKTIEILEDPLLRPENENYIYCNFWAYNSIQKHWYKVDIPAYGYRHKLKEKKIGGTNTQDQDVNKIKRDSAWKHMRLDFSVGGGSTWYEYKPQGLSLLVEGEKYFFQTPKNSSENVAHLINWLTNPYTQENRVYMHPIIYNKKVGNLVTSKQRFGFRGLGGKVPISLSLHYTFFNRLRIGGGSSFEIGYLKKLKLTGSAAHIAAYELKKPWIYNWKWFGILGYNIMAKPNTAVVMDIRVGRVYEVGSDLSRLWPISKIRYLYTNYYINLGICYEKKLNPYLRFSSRLSGDYTNYADKTYFAEKGRGIQLYHIGIQLETGVSFNFAKDTEGEKVKDLTS